jgi:predicted nuclease of predicted toxin-antitoxin system
MRFLADESCDFAIVRAVREAGYDVEAVSEINKGAEDLFVIEYALQKKRILLTEDKDFGQLVFAYGKNSLGVIFLRFQARFRQQIANDVVELIKSHGEKLLGCFVTVQIGRIRISHIFS